MTLKAEKFEELLASELQKTLEPQRGKALAAFRAQVAAEAERPAIAGTLKAGREISRGETWFWASVPSLAAACLAVVVTLKLLGGSGAVPGTTATTDGNQDVLADGRPGVHLIITPQVQQSDEVREQGGMLAHEQKWQWPDANERANYKLTSDEQEQIAPAPF